MMPLRATTYDLFYLVLIILIPSATSATTVYVSDSSSSGNSTSFLAALQDQNVSNVVLLTDYSVGTTFDPYVPGSKQAGQSPVPINRNVTVTGVNGVNTILDLEFVRSAVEICSTCILRFYNITVENERRGPGGAVDFALGKPGARLIFDNAIRLRPACTESTESATVANATPRSRYWPEPNGTQKYEIVNVTFRGVEYRDQLLLKDHTVDDPRRVQEGRGPMGGVAVRTYNSTRICRYTVDPACLKDRSSDTCVNLLVDEVLARESGAGGNGGKPSNTAAIAAGAAVAGVVVFAAIVAGVLLARKKRRRRRQLDLNSKSLGYGSFPSNGAAGSKDVEALHDVEKGETRKPVHAPLGGGKGWQLMSSLTTPLFQVTADATHVELGELLGAGSFGRVYHGRWAGREVAVKVIEHDTSTYTAVENEVQLMMNFNHPNIVRAFHCLIYQGTASHTSGSHARSAAGGSQGGVNTRGTPNTSLAQDDLGSTSRSLRQQQLATEASATSLSHYSTTPHVEPPLQRCISTSSGGALANRLAANDSAAALQRSAGCAAQSVADAAAAAADDDDVLGVTEDSTAAVLDDTAGKLSRSVAGFKVVAGAGKTAGIDKQGRIPRGGLTETPPEGSGDWGVSGGQTGGSVGSAYPTGRHAQRVETWIVQEFCDLGTLGHVTSDWDTADEGDARMLDRLLLLKDAAQGLQVLHNAKVVHGDLNARNVLVSSSNKNSNGMEAKLADFGLSKAMKQNKTHRTTNTVGTMSHMPPELLRYGRMSPATDVYAFGIMMWELYTCAPAFKKLHYGQFFETVVLRNLRPLVPPGMPADYQQLMEHCWATEPANRPPIDRVIECLRYMIIERQRNVQAARHPDDLSFRSTEKPELLNMPVLERHAWANLGPATGGAAGSIGGETPSPSGSPFAADFAGASAANDGRRYSTDSGFGYIIRGKAPQVAGKDFEGDREGECSWDDDTMGAADYSTPAGGLMHQQVQPEPQPSINGVGNTNWFV